MLDSEKPCPEAHCHVPDLPCQKGFDAPTKCPIWKGSKGQREQANIQLTSSEISDAYRLNWSGNSLGAVNLDVVATRSHPTLIGLFGAFNAGKTTWLTSLYLLLTHGKHPQSWGFAGSYTLGGWENIAYAMRRLHNSAPTFPPHTSARAGRVPGLLHLTLRGDNKRRRDLLLTDAPGEWFEKWTINQNSLEATGVNWMIQHSNAFIFFADCAALVGPERGKARQQLEVLSQRLGEQVGDRPIAVVWAKSDIEVRDALRHSLQSTFAKYFHSFREFHTSLPDKEEQGFNSILPLMDWLLESRPVTTWIDAPRVEMNDIFLAYRGRENL